MIASSGATVDLQAILKHFHNVEGGDGRFTARCPSHDDKRNSLSISQGEDGVVLFCCHAGCRFQEIIKAAGLDGVAARLLTPDFI
jgi:putative DNA primase/helicase